MLLKEAVLHIPRGSYAYPVGEKELQIVLRLAQRDEAVCSVFYDDRYRDRFPSKRQTLEKFLEDQLFSYYTAVLYLPTRRFGYCFHIKGQDEELWYTEEGLFHKKPEKRMEGLFQYPYLHWDEMEQIPKWVKSSIIYQIFPDRFCRGNPALPPETTPWGRKPRRDSFYGGDLKGIIERLGYLEELGINTLYLTPIFTSSSNHRYDTQNYYHIDPRLGTEETFLQLLDSAHQRGIRIIIDGVFNHTSHHFPPFLHLKKYGEDSRYRDWFVVREFPVVKEPRVSYETFGRDIPSMPCLNTSHPEVQEYLLLVGKYWTEKGIDGWRLDVANEVNPWFWRRFRREMKKINQNLFITGEIWHRAESYLQGDIFDSVMNYPFREILLDFFIYGRIEARALMKRLANLQMAYQREVNLGLWNLLGSHDTPRIKHLFQGKKRQQKQALLLQFTYPGLPLIYYGDEVGIPGGRDPDCRRTMIWEEKGQDQDLLSYYRRLIKLRRSHEALMKGDYRFEDLHPLLAFTRRWEKEEIRVILNPKKDPVTIQLPSQGKYRDLVKNREYHLHHPLTIKGEESLVLKKETTTLPGSTD